MATHEFVVPRSIPITSPASLLFHRLRASDPPTPNDPFVVVLQPSLDAEEEEEEVREMACRLIPNRSALAIFDQSY